MRKYKQQQQNMRTQTNTNMMTETFIIKEYYMVFWRVLRRRRFCFTLDWISISSFNNRRVSSEEADEPLKRLWPLCVKYAQQKQVTVPGMSYQMSCFQCHAFNVMLVVVVFGMQVSFNIFLPCRGVDLNSPASDCAVLTSQTPSNDPPLLETTNS
jgi:hypothetical protein